MRAFMIRFVKIYVLLLVFAGSVVGTYVFLHRGRIFPDPKTIVVYGTDMCGITTAMRTYLDRRGIPYLYGNADSRLVSDEMWRHLDRVAAQDASPLYAEFPVVLVNGRILERPLEKTVVQLYRQANGSPPQAR